MKRSWRLLLALLAVFALLAAACGDDDGDATNVDAGADDEVTVPTDEPEGPADPTAADTTTTEAGSETPAPSGEPVDVGLTYDIGGRGDQSFNDSAFAGIERAAEELGIDFTDVAPNDDGSNRPELLQLQADANDLVVAVGFLFADDVDAAADDNPDVSFAVIDDAMVDAETGEPRGENIAGLVFAEEQGSFLVGAAAALKSETGTIGFIGGVSGFGLIEKFQAGYEAGAREVNPDIEIISEYITEFPDFDGFTAPDRAREVALAMYESDADIVYHAAGGSGAGLFEAANQFSDDSGSMVWGIGVDSDQYNTVDPAVQDHVLTSMLKRVDNAVFEITEDLQNGEFPGGETEVYDLSVDGVGYSTSGGFVDDITDQLDAFKEQIVSGEIVVPTEP